MHLTFNCFHHNVLHYSMISYNILQSKHLKGQDPPVSDGHVFGSKEVSWIPLLVTSRFWIKGGQLDPLLVKSCFLDQRRSVGPPC